jgi:TetR/AcrR family transcriptional repressor of bet genes
MARPTNTETRRREITAALREVMAQKGYDGASVNDIAAAARLTPGLVHYHFKNKLEVLLGLVDDLAAQHQARLTEALAEAGPEPPGRLASFIDFHLSVRSADPEALACWITVGDEALREVKVRRRYREAVAAWRDVLRQIIDAGVRRRDFRTKDAVAAACAVVAAIQGYFALAAVDRTLIPRGSAARSVRAMAEGLLKTAEPLPSGPR